jgi:hypothetical protein
LRMSKKQRVLERLLDWRIEREEVVEAVLGGEDSVLETLELTYKNAGNEGNKMCHDSPIFSLIQTLNL